MRRVIKHNSLKRLGFTVWFLGQLWCLTVSAQYRFDNWTTEQGLPQNSVLAITQTRDGYLWLGTFNGLVRFDGVRFTVFDPSNTPDFTTRRIADLCEDGSGALWIGTSDGGLARYQNGDFKLFTQTDGLPTNSVRQLQRALDGSLLISTDLGSVWWREGKFIATEKHWPATDWKVHLGRSGIQWALGKDGLHAYQAGKEVRYDLPVGKQSIMSCQLYEDRQGNLWASIREVGIFKIKDGVVTNYTQRFNFTAEIYVWKILEDREGSLWFGLFSSGLARLKDDVITVFTTANGLSANATRGLYQDREGTLWIGTGGGGLNRLTPQFITGYAMAQGLAGDIVHAVLEDRAGNIWAATAGGLSKIHQGVVTNYAYSLSTGSLPLRGLQALHEDSSGRLWLGGWDGLCSFKDGRFTAALPNLNVWAIQQDRQGDLWVGTHYGLIKFPNSEINGPRLTFTTKDGLPSDTIRAIYEDRRGTLWFGTEGGLAKYEAGRLVAIPNPSARGKQQVWSIYEDTEGVLWLGSFAGGLNRFKEGRFTNYSMAQGLYNNGAFQILEDANGYLWMSCFRGIYRVSKQQLNDYADGKVRSIACQVYGKNEGMFNPDCNGGRQPSGVKTHDGRLLFTTLGGVTVVNLASVKFNPLPPPVQIESAALDRATANIQSGLRIAPEQSNLEIAYTALSFIKPEHVRFKYQLIGQDHDWIEAGTRRVANYSYLRPGSYTFRVIAANSDGVWNTEGAQLTLVVLPAFYQTWWFRLIALLAVAGSLAWVFKRRLDRANRARLAQEEFSRRLLDSQEQERKRIAAELHDSLGQNLLVIKNYALMGLNAAKGANPAREHLDEISDSATLALEEVRQIAHNLRPYQLERLGLTNTLETMLRQVANASDIGFTWEIERIDGLFAAEDEISIYRIVQEALNNILKHSEANEASVRINHVGDTIQLTITDDGRGFTVEPANRAELQKRGLGLTGTAERVRILGGQMVVQSAPGQGTQLHITLKPNLHVRTD